MPSAPYLHQHPTYPCTHHTQNSSPPKNFSTIGSKLQYYRFVIMIIISSIIVIVIIIIIGVELIDL